MKRLSMLLAAAVLEGCQDHSPVGIELHSAPVSVASHAAVSTDPRSPRLAIDDAIDRIVPALSDAEAARLVGAALKELQRALQSGNVADSPALASAAQDAVQRYAKLDSGDEVLVDAIRLALKSVTGPD